MFSFYSRYYFKLNPDPCKPLAFLLIPAMAILGNTHTVSVKSRYNGLSYFFLLLAFVILFLEASSLCLFLKVKPWVIVVYMQIYYACFLNCSFVKK